MFKRIILAAALATAATAATPASAQMFAAKSNWGCLANEGGNAVLRPCSKSRHTNQFEYKPGENLFYGPLRQNGQCLDTPGGRPAFAACNGSASQTWKFQANGEFNNGANVWLRGQGNALVAVRSPAPGAWVNATYKVIYVPQTVSVPPGTPLRIDGANLVNANTGALVAAGGGNLVAAGGGNLIGNDGGSLVAAGGGNLVAAGGGNVVAGANAAQLVAAGGGN